MKYLLKDIVWDIDDDDDETRDSLPTKVELEINGSGLDNLSEEQLEEYGFSDYLSDKYGWCVKSFSWESV